MKIVYIAHPIGGDVEANLADLRRIIKKINLEAPDIVPFCPYYADVVSMDDNIAEERARGMKNDRELLERGFIDELWLTGGRISAGMQMEMGIAAKRRIPIINQLNF